LATDGDGVDREDRLADVFERHRVWLLRRLALVVGDVDEAQDLCQETFLRAAEHELPDGDDAARWLATVGVRLAIDERRRRRRWGFLPIRESDSTWALTADPDLWTALAKLDRRTRAALLMTVVDGFTQGEAAEVLGVPRGTLASWLSRARDHLRPILDDRG
jgi:RNA polymerase sigma factor (sigma-70 family)